MSNNPDTKKIPYKTIFIVIVVLAFSFFIWLNGYNFSRHNNADQTPQVNIDIHTMESTFQEISELATEEYNFTNVGVLDEAKQKLFFISLPFTAKKSLMVYSGVVKAGVKDFSKISIDQPDDIHKTITINCPNVEIFDDPVIYPESIEIYKDSVFAHFTPDDITEFEASEQDTARQIAIDNGLLTKAAKHLKELLELQAKSRLSNTVYKDYQVTVKFPEE